MHARSEVETPFESTPGSEVAVGQPLGQAEKSPPTAGLVYFGSRPPWKLIDLADLWQHRELLWILAGRDLRVRYRQTLVGIAWVILQPLASTCIFLVLFTLLGRQPTVGDTPYVLILLTGLIPWQLFAAIINQSSVSLVANQHLLGKVYFPRLVLPIAAALPPIVDFLVGMFILACALVFYGITPHWGLLLLPVFALLTVLAGLACGIFLSALNAVYRDAAIVAGYLLQLGLFVSPVIYATNALIPPAWRSIFALNPMVGAIEGFRWSLLGLGSPAFAVMLALTVQTVLSLLALAYFRRVERYVADRI